MVELCFLTKPHSFGGTATTNVIRLYSEPDSVRIGTAADGSSKTLLLFLHAHHHGQVTTQGTVMGGTLWIAAALRKTPHP